jgi:hypothetical protein
MRCGASAFEGFAEPGALAPVAGEPAAQKPADASVRAMRPATLSGKYMKDLFHVAADGIGGLFRRAPVFARVHIGGIPVPPVVSGVGVLVLVVVLGCLVQKLGQSRDVHG